MSRTLTEQIIAEHLVSGKLIPGQEIAIRIDQTLTQDATGTMAYLQFEAMGVPRVTTELSVSYVDHNTLQTGFENADDHRYLQTVAAQVRHLLLAAGQRHLPPGPPRALRRARARRCWAPTATRPPPAGSGMLAIGAGGLDVAVRDGRRAVLPDHARRWCVVKLTGELQPWVSAKDVILELLRRLTVKGGVGKVFEYVGAGVDEALRARARHDHQHGRRAGRHDLASSPATTVTRAFLAAQGREEALCGELAADPGARYDEVIEIDLDDTRAADRRAAQPGQRAGRSARWRALPSTRSASAAAPTRSLSGPACWWPRSLAGKTVHPGVSLTIVPRLAAGARDDRRRTARWPTSSPPARAYSRPPAARASAWGRRPRPSACPCAPSTATSRAAAGRRTRRSTSSARRSPRPRRSPGSSPTRATCGDRR